MAKPKTVAIEDYDKLNAITVSLRNSLAEERIRTDRLMAETTKRADQNYDLGNEWRAKCEAHEKTIGKSRDEFASLKIQMHETEMALAFAKGYQSRVHEQDDNARPMIPQTTVIQQPPAERARFSPHDTYRIMTEAKRAPHWTNY